MPTCPNGHQSVAEDWCEVCGHRMAGAVPQPPPPAFPGPAAPGDQAGPGPGEPTGGDPRGQGGYGYPGPPTPPPGADTMRAELCPQCRTPREAMAPFCEECRYNFLTHTPTTYAPPPPPPSPGPQRSAFPPPPPQQAQPPQHYEYQASRPSQMNRPAEPLTPEQPGPLPPPAPPGPAESTGPSGFPSQPGPPGPAEPFAPLGPPTGAGGPPTPPPPPSPYAQPSPTHPPADDDWVLPPPNARATPPAHPTPPTHPVAPGPYEQPSPPPPPQTQPQPQPQPQSLYEPPRQAGPGGPGAPVAPFESPPPPGPYDPHQQDPQQQWSGGPGPADRSADSGSWVAVIGLDREYFMAMMGRSGPEAAGLNLPAYSPEQRLPLTGGQVTIGRRRHSTGESPDIDLARAPEDPGVSHQHAVLIQQPDGGWAVVDQNSTNGTTINGAEDPIQPYIPVPLHEGDRVHVGAWTTITVQRG